MRIAARRETAAAGAPRPTADSAAHTLSGAELRSLQKEIAALDRALAKLSDRISTKHVELAEHDQSDHVGVSRLSAELRELDAELADTEERWLQSSARLESSG